MLKDMLFFLIMAGIHYCMIEFLLRYDAVFRIRYIKSTLIGYSVVAFLDAFFCLATGIPRITLGVLTAFCFIFGIVNYFIFIFHGSPFTIGELKNFRTAMAVVKSYKFKMPLKRAVGTALLLLSAAAALFFCDYAFLSRQIFLYLLLFFGLIVFISFFAPKPLLKKKLLGWSWSVAFSKYGYIPVFIQQTRLEMKDTFEKPEKFDRDEVISFIDGYRTEKSDDGRKPDIIFIINETFFDLAGIIDLHTDEDVLKNFRNLNGAVRGRAAAPCIGGGTNVTEYECLSSNSVKMMPGIVSPFNVIDMSRSNTVLSYLKHSGYRTFATHPGEPTSYRRNQAFPAMGFDGITFINDYKDPEYFGNRSSYITDRSMYKNLIRWYEEISSDGPVFIYGLTIQNHGDWISNAGEHSLVQIGKDFGKYTDVFGEFQSCTRLSDEAFSGLIDHFRKSDRDVIVAMVGDHSPSFVKEQDFHDLGGKDDLLSLGTTPYIIWSNRDLRAPEKTDIISMPLFLPAVFEAAGMKLSPYYEALNSLRREGLDLSKYEENDLSQNDRILLDRYYSLEYLNCTEPEMMRDYWK